MNTQAAIADADWRPLRRVVIDDLIARHGLGAVEQHRPRIERAIRSIERALGLVRIPDPPPQ